MERLVDSVRRDEILKTGDVKSLGPQSEPWGMGKQRVWRTGCQSQIPYGELSVTCLYMFI